MPQNGINPIIVGTQIINQLQNVISRYTTSGELAVITVSEFKVGDAPNIIPDKAYMNASIRAVSDETLSGPLVFLYETVILFLVGVLQPILTSDVINDGKFKVIDNLF